MCGRSVWDGGGGGDGGGVIRGGRGREGRWRGGGGHTGGCTTAALLVRGGCGGCRGRWKAGQGCQFSKVGRGATQEGAPRLHCL